MATETENYGLIKPGATDFYNVKDQNDNMDAVDAALKGLEDGKAALDPETGKVVDSQMPPMDYAPTDHTHTWDKVEDKPESYSPSHHAASHGAGGSDPLTAADVGADSAGSAAAVQSALTAHTGRADNPHGVTAAQAGAVPTGRKVNGKALTADVTLSAADVGASASSHTHTADQVGAAAASHTHVKSQITDFPATMPPSAHSQGAATITAGTLAGQVLASAGATATLTTAQVRNIYAGTGDMVAGSTALTTGAIYLVYE